MKVYLEGGPMDGYEHGLNSEMEDRCEFEYGLWLYKRTGRTFAGLRVYRYAG